MKAHVLFFPAALMTAACPAHATVFMTVEQAQTLMFPGATFTQDFRTLSEQDAAAIAARAGVSVRHRQLRAWRVSDGGWFLVDEVVGDHDFIPFALALDREGEVKAIEILEYREYTGDQIRNPKWLAQFAGKRDGASLELDADIQNISGATLSSRHLTEGIRRLLASYALVLATH